MGILKQVFFDNINENITFWLDSIMGQLSFNRTKTNIKT
jgi:hypothetical protein